MDHEWVLRPSYSKQAGEKVPGCDVAMKSKRRELRSSLAQPSYSQTRSKIISVAKRSQSGFCEYHWLKIDFQQFLQKQCSQNVAKRFCKYYWLKSRFSRFGYVSYVFWVFIIYIFNIYKPIKKRSQCSQGHFFEYHWLNSWLHNFCVCSQL